MQLRPPADEHGSTHPQVLPVEKEDARAIAVFSFEATASSPMDVFFLPTAAHRARAVDDLETRLLTLLEDPARFILRKVVDPETELVASYAVWERIGHRDKRKDPEIAVMNDEIKQSGQHEEPDDPRRRLGTYVGAETKRFRDAWAAGMDYVELQGLATAPEFQRRGYATALLEWGHRQADLDKSVSFLVGSPMGRPLYAALGWHEVGQIVVDMRDWVPGAEAGDRGWGTWKLYHMIRLPKAVI